MVRGRTRVSEWLCASPPQRLGARAGRRPGPTGSPTVGPTLAGLRRSAAWSGESHAKGSARHTACGSRVSPSVAERSRTSPSSRPPEPRLPPTFVRKCPSAAGPANRASAAAPNQFSKRGAVGPLRAQRRKWPKGRERRGAERLPGSRRTGRAEPEQDGGGCTERERFLHGRILLLCPPRHLPEASSQHLLFAPLTPPPFSISSEWHVHF